MDLTQVILGDVVTEKTERLKAQRTYTVRVHPHATKVDVANALRRYFGVEPIQVRIIYVRPKSRLVGRGRTVQKRDASKRALVTLSPKSKTLDLSTFQTH